MPATVQQLRSYAIRQLSRREYSKKELRDKLTTYAKKMAPDAGLAAAIENVVEELVQKEWLSDNRFAHMQTQRRAARYGDRYILHHLADKGIDKPLSTQVIQDLAEEKSRLQKLLEKEKPLLNLAAKTRLVQKLQRRGFALNNILATLRQSGLEANLVRSPRERASDSDYFSDQ